MKNLFSKNVKLVECSKKGCEKLDLSFEERTKFDKCNFKGSVISDPDSKVTLSQCDANGFTDISIVSEKVPKKTKQKNVFHNYFFKSPLIHHSYRIDKDGKVAVPQVRNFTDVVNNPITDHEGLTKGNSNLRSK